MKKLLIVFLASGLMIGAYSCKKDSDNDKPAPTENKPKEDERGESSMEFTISGEVNGTYTATFSVYDVFENSGTTAVWTLIGSNADDITGAEGDIGVGVDITKMITSSNIPIGEYDIGSIVNGHADAGFTYITHHGDSPYTEDYYTTAESEGVEGKLTITYSSGNKTEGKFEYSAYLNIENQVFKDKKVDVKGSFTVYKAD